MIQQTLATLPNPDPQQMANDPASYREQQRQLHHLSTQVGGNDATEARHARMNFAEELPGLAQLPESVRSDIGDVIKKRSEDGDYDVDVDDNQVLNPNEANNIRDDALGLAGDPLTLYNVRLSLGLGDPRSARRSLAVALAQQAKPGLPDHKYEAIGDVVQAVLQNKNVGGSGNQISQHDMDEIMAEVHQVLHDGATKRNVPAPSTRWLHQARFKAQKEIGTADPHKARKDFALNRAVRDLGLDSPKLMEIGEIVSLLSQAGRFGPADGDVLNHDEAGNLLKYTESLMQMSKARLKKELDSARIIYNDSRM